MAKDFELSKAYPGLVQRDGEYYGLFEAGSSQPHLDVPEAVLETVAKGRLELLESYEYELNVAKEWPSPAFRLYIGRVVLPEATISSSVNQVVDITALEHAGAEDLQFAN